MRKLFLLGAASVMAYIAGRGMAQQVPGTPPGQPGTSRIASLIPILFAPRWMKPLLLARAFLPGRRIRH
jgi:hypothetical protein